MAWQGKEFPKMRNIMRTGLALVGMSAALVPVAGFAQTAPAGYAQSPPPGTMMIMGANGKPVAVSPGPASVAAPAAGHKHLHLHNKKTVCANCAKKQDMDMAGARIVACAHSKNGVCPACRTLLEMPGTVTMGAPTPAPGGEAPGRAMVSSNGPAGNTAAMQAGQYASQPSQAVYDPSMTPEPTPIGLMQTNYARPGMAPAGPAGPQGAAMASSVPTASSMMPGHSLDDSGVNPAPYQHKPTSSANPHVIGHVLGLKSLGADWREQRARRKTEAHASIPYNNEGTTINELPSSMVYGKGPR